MNDKLKLWVCEFLVPTHYNDGRPVEVETRIAIKQVIEQRFSGFTDLGYRTGSWNRQIETHEAIEVALEKSRVDELRSVVRKIGGLLGQEKMYFKITSKEAELLDSDEDTLFGT